MRRRKGNPVRVRNGPAAVTVCLRAEPGHRDRVGRTLQQATVFTALFISIDFNPARVLNPGRVNVKNKRGKAQQVE